MKRAFSLVVIAFLALFFTSALAAEDIFETDSVGQPLSNEEWKSLLNGAWHADTAVGSGYARRALFTREMCLLLPSQYDDEDIDILVAEWDVKNDELYLKIDGSWMPTALDWFDTPESIELCTYAISIGGTTLYKVSDEPYFPDLLDYGIEIHGEEIIVQGDGEWDDSYDAAINGNAILPPTDEDWSNLLMGSWSASEPMGRGRKRTAVFTEDHACVLLPDDEEGDLPPIVGNWDVSEGELAVYIGEGEAGDIARIPLTLASSLKTDDPDALFEIYIGGTLMFKYMDEPDPYIDIDQYLNDPAYGFYGGSD